MTAISRQTYSPLNQIITIGAIPLQGFASGTFLTIRPNTDLINEDVGSDTEIHTTYVANNTSTAEFRVYYDNPNYKLIQAAMLAQQTAGGLFIPFSSVNTADPLDTVTSAKSHFKRFDDRVYSNVPTDMIRTITMFLHNTLRV